jgi:hypothetical protein
MSIINLNNGLFNGIGGSYGMPSGKDPVYPNINNLDRTKKAYTFCDFFGDLGDFNISSTTGLFYGDVSFLQSETLQDPIGAGVLTLSNSATGTTQLGIRRSTNSGSLGNCSMVRPFVWETSYYADDPSDATNNYTIYFGLDQQTGVFPSGSSFNGGGIWFEYNHAVNSGKWQVKTCLIDPSFNFVSDTINTNNNFIKTPSPYFTKLRIEKEGFGWNAGQFKAYIDNVLVATIPLSIERTLVANQICEARFIFRRTAGTTTRRIRLDYLHYEVEVSR